MLVANWSPRKSWEAFGPGRQVSRHVVRNLAAKSSREVEGSAGDWKGN